MVTVIETETGELSQLLRELMKSVLRETPIIRPKWLTRSQVAVYLNVNKATIDLWRKHGLPCHRPNGQPMFFVDEVDEWMRGRGK